MSQLGGGNSERAGGIHYDVDVRGAAQAQEQLNAVGGAAQNLGQNAEAADKQVKKANVGIAAWAQRLKETTSVFRNSVNAVTQFAGRITGLIGLFGLVSASVYGVVKGVGALWDGLVKMDQRLKEAPANWQKVIDKHNEYLAVLEKINQVQGKAAPGTVAESLVKNIDKARVEELSKELASRDKRIDELRALIREQNRKISVDESLGINEQQGTAAIQLTLRQYSYELTKLLQEREELSAYGRRAQRSESLIDEEKLASAFAEAVSKAIGDSRTDSIMAETLYNINERLVGIESRLGGER